MATPTATDRETVRPFATNWRSRRAHPRSEGGRRSDRAVPSGRDDATGGPG